MKKCLNNRANHENLDLLHFFSKIGLIRLEKKNVLKIIPYFVSAPCSIKIFTMKMEIASQVQILVNLFEFHIALILLEKPSTHFSQFSFKQYIITKYKVNIEVLIRLSSHGIGQRN